MEIKTPDFYLDLANKMLAGKLTPKAHNAYKDVKSYYHAIDQNLPDDTVMYDLYRFQVAPDDYMLIGMTCLHPVLVNGECNMTKGHFHVDEKDPEIYIGVEGEGLLILMDKEGYAYAEKVFPGSFHYIYGHMAHRLVNTCDEVFKAIAIWNENSGHDYDTIKKTPFPKRVFKSGNNIVIKDA